MATGRITGARRVMAVLLSVGLLVGSCPLPALANGQARLMAMAASKKAKKSNPMKVEVKSKSVTQRSLALDLYPLSVTSAQGKVTYKKVSGDKCLTINKTAGYVTVKKGASTGSHSIKVRVTAAGNSSYKKSKTFTKTIKISVTGKDGNSSNNRSVTTTAGGEDPGDVESYPLYGFIDFDGDRDPIASEEAKPFFGYMSCSQDATDAQIDKLMATLAGKTTVNKLGSKGTGGTYMLKSGVGDWWLASVGKGGTGARIKKKSSAKSEKWVIERVRKGKGNASPSLWTIKNASTGKYLVGVDASGQLKYDDWGAAVGQGTTIDTLSMWRIYRTGNQKAVEFVNEATGLALDVRDGKAASGTVVQSWGRSDGKAQRWLLK